MIEYEKSDIRNMPLFAVEFWYKAERFGLPKLVNNRAKYDPLFVYERGRGTTVYYQPIDWDIENDLVSFFKKNNRLLNILINEYIKECEAISKLSESAVPKDFEKLFHLLLKAWPKLSFIIPIGELLSEGDKSIAVKKCYEARKKTANVIYIAASKLTDLAREIKPELKDFVDVLLTEEVLSSEKVSKKELGIRKKGFIYFAGALYSNVSLKNFKKEKGVAISKSEELLIQNELKNPHSIKGAVAMNGTVKGKARIVLNNHDLRKIVKGDILVVPMTTTTPDCILAMKKAAGFVTDEGGITCHAAIVARELKKPCIIGTKIATRILKDGDLIEVNGSEGKVRILSR
jgi:phosphoenolpyruvate synthase/pyruvate phosphate dikinase